MPIVPFNGMSPNFPKLRAASTRPAYPGDQSLMTHPFEQETLDELRNHVYHTLCGHEQLEIGAFPMTERTLVRSGRPCGIHFCLHGPRSVKYTAIWETDRNTVLFYDATGERFMKTQPLNSERLASIR